MSQDLEQTLTHRIGAFFVWLFFMRLFILPQSFSMISLSLMLIVVLFISAKFISGQIKLVSLDAFYYFLAISVISTFWILISVILDNNVKALNDSFRLYVIYNVMFFLIVSYISNRDFYKNILNITTRASIIIALIAIYTVLNHVLGLESIPPFIEQQMYLQIGIHDGYTQLNNINIGMYTFLIPFLVAYILMEAGKVSKLTYIALILSVIAVLLASRRMILFIFVISPFICVIIDKLITSKFRKILIMRLVKIYFSLGILAFSGLFVVYIFDLLNVEGFFRRVTDIFVYDGRSARQTQFWSLIDGFVENPIFGSGFGGEASVVRSVERPWTYELTYVRLLFNAGLAGSVMILSVFVYYIYKAFQVSAENTKYHSINTALFVGYFSLLLASTSNPYMGSFDFLFVIIIIPLIINLGLNEARQTRLAALPLKG